MQCPNRNNFCYLCGLLVSPKYSRSISKSFVEGFEGYFVMLYVPNLWYAPEIVCYYCYRAMVAWKYDENKRKKYRIKYVSPVIWLPQSEHSVDSCYFCQTQPRTRGFRYNIREKIDYADVSTIIPARLRSAVHPKAPSEEQKEQEVIFEAFDMESVELSQTELTRYNKLSRDIRELGRKIKEVEPDHPFRIEQSAILLEKLYMMGLISTKWDLSQTQKVTASCFCRRRLPVIMVRNKMSQTIPMATKLIEQGHVRVGVEVVKDPAFLVTRNLEDFVTWVDTSAIKKHVLEYNNERDDFDIV